MLRYHEWHIYIKGQLGGIRVHGVDKGMEDSGQLKAVIPANRILAAVLCLP